MARGGARTGAGRPKGEETKVMRIPVGKVRDVMAVIESESYEIPLYSCKIQAGIPAPADDYIEGIVNLNSLLIPRPKQTFLVRATGDSMIDVGIFNDDTLIVDSSIPPKHGKIVIAALNGELTVKRLSIQADGKTYLLPENPQFNPIPVTPECDLHIWGVVINCIRKLG
ncbi:LexA family protein [Ostreibacterium oceani]|uniref:Translesion error-prone DNA polymerase V autoproteolytic subunit n=1 Tax=Ostreibacterium oceani TaxID=2654998 RepID=A0A6N7EYP8_9GAMM|nr:translesion error-prone DNA polymerase V autoproteolytic subunit [Ostreibacterium oceani]MPV85608.1 translesion error-prone DNA polymerase V autoproteolytic subunit [Ostreibacterium oceani]